jgi:hypothetical protein
MLHCDIGNCYQAASRRLAVSAMPETSAVRETRLGSCFGAQRRLGSSVNQCQPAVRRAGFKELLVLVNAITFQSGSRSAAVDRQLAVRR